MLIWRISSVVVVLTSMLVEQGCLFKKAPPKASIVIPPAPQAQAPQPLPAPPQLPPNDSKPSVKTTQLPTLPPPVVPVKPPKVKPARRTPASTVATVPDATQNPPVEAPQISTPSVIASPAPSLQPILGEKEVQERTQRIQQYLEKARLTVLRAERSKPDAKTKDLIAQVRVFLQQAEDARRVDLVRAENLAERAEVLSRGLSR